MKINNSKNKLVEESETHFSSDSQLLSELGERLISNHLIALGELIKNSYDADANKVNVWLAIENEQSVLKIRDDGNGMNRDQFLVEWMKVGTRTKIHEQVSRNFKRPLTGSKGIGRFAVRFLGGSLKLDTVAFDYQVNEYRRIIATFPWKDIKEGDLGSFSIKYRISAEGSKTEEGTTLTIGDLRFKWSDDELRNVAKEVLDIVDPPLPVRIRKKIKGIEDPGFSVYFGAPEHGERITQAADELLNRWQALMNVEVNGPTVQYSCTYKDVKGSRNWLYTLPNKNLIGNVSAQIRYYPRRKDMFTGIGAIDGRSVVKFLREKGGVRVYDRGFRMLPYGDPDDDWLNISSDNARNTRQWRSSITEKLHPRSSLPRKEGLDPTLSIPANHQLLGVVIVQSSRPLNEMKAPDSTDMLEPAMNREGFVDNHAFQQLVDIIRGAVELIAVVDRDQTIEAKEEQSKRELSETNQKIEQAIHYVKDQREVSEPAKQRIIKSYKEIKRAVSESAETHKEALKAIESMSLLGVVAGFMTHEVGVMERATNTMIHTIEATPKDKLSPDMQSLLRVVKDAYSQINKQLNYTRMFVSHIHDKSTEPFLVKPQIELVLKTLLEYMEQSTIEIKLDVPSKLLSPPIPVGVYSGILMNLLTNAAKAVISSLNSRGERKILIRTSEDKNSHILQVMDSGSGIPPSFREFIFEPFVSTTSEVEGPFGNGMGLGLYICKRVIESRGGKIYLSEPDPGYSTCFEVMFNDN